MTAIRWKRASIFAVLAMSPLAAALFEVPVLAAQDPARTRESTAGLPRGVGREVIDRWNAVDTKRVRGPFTLAATDTLRGDLAIVDGPAKIAGVVTGQVVVINANISFEPTGRIDGTLTVVGGEVQNRTGTSVKGDVREWLTRLRYTESGEHFEPVAEMSELARWQRWGRNHEVQGAWGDFFAASAHTYNRVEGLPLLLGPRFRTRHGDTRVTVEALGIFRTGEQLSWEPLNLGHRVRAELRQGHDAGYALGARIYDEVEPVERWALTDNEVGLASALFTRDFRDYYQRHGGSGYASLFGPGQTNLTVSLARERWDSRSARNPWSLFYSGDQWRINPASDNGLINLVTVTGQLDTRNNIDRPRSGWLLKAEFERGAGTLTKIAPTTVGTRSTETGSIVYSRALFDLRRYNRLAPNTQLNLRMIGGGVLAGDQLPLQRRFSVSGADALPGYDFRSKTGLTDVGSCASGPDTAYAALGRPAQCDRFALFQAEWKTEFSFSLFRDPAEGGQSRWPFNRRFRAEGNWVVFMNTGRGWLIGGGDDALHYGKADLPTLRSWRTDVGGGLDFGSFGVYIAQSVTDTDLRPNVFLRLGRRF
ncbi:MAG: hypothetical protein ABJB74_15115 [Gemmatimonas sp.]